MAGAGETAPAEPQFQPCHVDYVPTPALCTEVEVPADWDRPNGPKLALHVAVLPAKGGPGTPDPLFVLAGGPGQAATSYGRLITQALDRVHRRRDIVLMDQRGTGASHGLPCALQNEALNAWRPALLQRRISACLGPISAATSAAISAPTATETAIDVRHFTLREVVRDVDAVRAALGYRTINLWGGSYGTRTALLYLRHYPDNARAAILDGALSPTQRLYETVARDAQRAMDLTLTACQDDPACRAAFPELPEVLDTVLTHLAEAPQTVWIRRPNSGESVRITIDRDFVAQALRSALYIPSRASLIPWAITRAAGGDYQIIAALAQESYEWAGSSMDLGATLAILCSEEIPRITAAEAQDAARGSFTAGSYDRFWRAACRVWPTQPLDANYGAPVTVEVPVLVLSGGLDPVTPPSAGEEVVRYLPNAVHLVAPQLGHNVSPFGCAPRLIAAFIDQGHGRALDGSCLATMARPPFVTATTGPQP